MTAHNRLVLALAVVLILLAAGLRFSQLGAQSLWNDEGSSYGQSLRTPAEIAVNAAADIHPPGYYWLLAAWRILTGESEFALRAMSAFASILGAALAFALGNRLYGHTAGLAALAAVAVNTFSITYAQEARMYALLALCSAASMCAFIDVIQRPSRRAVILLAFTSAAGLYTNYAYAGVLAVQAVMGAAWLMWAVRSKRDVRQVMTAAALGYGAALLAYLPWLPTALRQITTWGSTGEIIPLGEALPVAVGWLAVGSTYALGFSVAVVLLLAFGVYNLTPRPPFHTGEEEMRGTDSFAKKLDTINQGTESAKNDLHLFPLSKLERGSGGEVNPLPSFWTLALPPVWVLMTVGGFLALGLFREANLKFLLPAQVGMALWIGRGAWVLWHLPLKRDGRLAIIPKAAAVLSIIAMIFGARAGIAALHTDPRYQRDDYRGIAQAIAGDGQPDAAVILNAPGQIEVFSYYARQFGPDWVLVPLPVGLTVDADATRAVIDGLLRDHRRIYAVLWGTNERDPQRVVETALNTKAYPIDDRWFGSVRLARYITPGPLNDAQVSGAAFEFDGGVIELVDYAVSATNISPGDALEIAFNWRADTPPPRNYKITVQLLAPDSTLVVQRDTEPVGYQRPTTTWESGEVIHDRHALVIPNSLAPAQYRLIVGLYNSGNPSERLAVNERDALTLAEISVGADGE